MSSLPSPCTSEFCRPVLGGERPRQSHAGLLNSLLSFKVQQMHPSRQRRGRLTSSPTLPFHWTPAPSRFRNVKGGQGQNERIRGFQRREWGAFKEDFRSHDPIRVEEAHTPISETLLVEEGMWRFRGKIPPLSFAAVRVTAIARWVAGSVGGMKAGLQLHGRANMICRY